VHLRGSSVAVTWQQVGAVNLGADLGAVNLGVDLGVVDLGPERLYTG
jgi:hypothetical protein